MTPGCATDFRYLNAASQWLGFQRQGLTLAADGSLSLSALPGAILPTIMPPPAKPSGPAGIAVGPRGVVFHTSPRSHQIHCTTPDRQCPPEWPPACASDELCWPRGLLFHSKRGALFVADTANRCVRLLDPHSFLTRETWTSSAAADGPPMRAPWQLVQDEIGDVYVLDYRTRRIDRFNMHGQWQPDFWNTLKRQALVPKRPRLIAAAPDSQSPTALYILDARNRTLYWFDTSGHLRMRATIPDPLSSGNPLRCDALAIDKNCIYLTDGSARRILIFARDFTDGQPLQFLGVAGHFNGAPAALACTSDSLALCAGDDTPPVNLGFDAFTTSGWLVGGPFSNPMPFEKYHWHRMKAQIIVPVGSHARLFIAQVPTGSPLPPGPPFTAPPWQEQPIDAPHCLFEGVPGTDLCVALQFQSDGGYSPTLSNILLEFALQLPTQNLPPVLLDDPCARKLLTRLLALLNSEFEDLESEYTNLPLHFDANAVDQNWISWLAGWLNAELPIGDLQAMRAALAAVYPNSQWRGTCDQIRSQVATLAGVDIQIEEPILCAVPWILPDAHFSCTPQAGVDPPRLGITTILAPGSPQGAVLGNSAIVNESTLVSSADYGAPIYERLAHRILIRVYPGANYSSQTEATLKTIVQQQKPAHVAADYFVVPAAMSVGFQSRIGIDAIVASPSDAKRPTTKPIKTRGFTYSPGHASRIGDPAPPVPQLIGDA
jgi:hypothetical protein